MTQALHRLRTSSVGFTLPESQITMAPFPIPEDWPRAYGMTLTRNAMAAIWGARDAQGTIYLYEERLFPPTDPSENIRAIQQLGEWIPGVINLACITGSEADKQRIAQFYREQDLHVSSSQQGEDAGVCQLWQLLACNRVKVFSSLSGFLAEYRIGDEQSPLLLCSYALVLEGRQQMRSRPVVQVRSLELPDRTYYSPSVPGGWMV